MKTIFIVVIYIITFSFSALAQESIILTKGKQTRIIPKGDVLEVTYGAGLGASGVLQFTPEGQPILVPGVDKSIQYAINFEQTDAVLLPRKGRAGRALLFGAIGAALGTGLSVIYSNNNTGVERNYASGFSLGMIIGGFTGYSILGIQKRPFRKSKGWRFEVK
jgi:hypothetical protein